MPPMFTSTNWTTLVRKVVHSARHVHSLASTRSALTRIQRARLAFRHAVHETYPSLHTSALPRQYIKPILPRAPPLRQAGGVIRSSPRLAARGPALVNHVGLGSARTYATTPITAGIPNASVFLRACMSLDDLPKSHRYKPYRPRKSSGRRKRRSSSHSSWISELNHFFPSPIRRPTEEPLPVIPEKLVTPNITTTLSIALSPSLQELLQPTTQITYREAELGMSIFTDLLRGIPSLITAFSIHGSTRVYPLLAKLSSLGVLEIDEIRHTNATLDIVMDPTGRPDILTITFPRRSVKDVRKLIGETPGEMEWFTLHQIKEFVPPITTDETWATIQTSPVVEEVDRAEEMDNSLVFPAPEEVWGEASGEYSEIVPYEPSISTPMPSSSTISTPSTLSTPSTPLTPIEGLASSVISVSSDISDPSWSVELSESDLEIESLDLSIVEQEVQEVWRD